MYLQASSAVSTGLLRDCAGETARDRFAAAGQDSGTLSRAEHSERASAIVFERLAGLVSRYCRTSLSTKNALLKLLLGHTVIVDGRIVMSNQKVRNVDMDAALDEAEIQANALVRRAGLEPHITPPGWGMIQRTFCTPIELPEALSPST
ncbi:hypothetical protein [Pseudaminobacter sp. NGMCC 1.201702]|uniref:hypothetical protein n=1 Tax=Pseudaminobacter sp. NGMCC 1.201702 TaxID=3391825 RepID=UPI0039EFF66B